jgi:hypothetical protein
MFGKKAMKNTLRGLASVFLNLFLGKVNEKNFLKNGHPAPRSGVPYCITKSVSLR